MGRKLPQWRLPKCRYEKQLRRRLVAVLFFISTFIVGEQKKNDKINFPGPVVSALANKYGCRAVCIAGSIISASAFVLSTFSTSVNMLMLTYGILGGFGFGLIYLPAVVAVGYYFETKRSLATGIAVCGSGFGTFTFAPLANLLLEHFDWKNANLILAGLILNCAIFGALMRPLT